MSEIKYFIKELATQLGFSNIGVAKAAPLKDGKAHLEEWLDRGYQGTMSWMDKNTNWRTDPTTYFPGAKSIISLGMNYYTNAQYNGDISKGKISRYAWGEDYHDEMKNKLEELVDELARKYPDNNFKACCDTAPVMEKVWAAKAGIGWIGKNTNLLTKEVGSWLFLGEIISDMDIEVDIPAADYCGSCTLCIDLCPTNALVEPYKLNSNLCISYLTIEHKGDFPENTKAFDGWLYGCDICQEVCPWNNFQSETDNSSYHPTEIGTDLDLDRVEEMTQKDFNFYFKNSPIKRTKLIGLKRNAQHLREHAYNKIITE